jgi:hypothetical protein
MSAATEALATPAANGSQNQSFVSRVAAIPVVADTLSTVHTTLSNNSYSKPLYGKAEGAAHYLYEQSKPLQAKLAGPIGQVDAVVNKGLDYVQAKAPYVFEAKTDELISRARQPADQAYAFGKTYTDAVTAKLQPFTDALVQSQAKLSSLQEKLAAAVKDPKGVPTQLKALSEQVVAEVEKVSQLVKDKRKELPAQAQHAVAPYLDALQTSFSDIKAELTKPDTPLITRASNVLQYSRDKANPMVREAVERLKAYLGKAEKKGHEASDDAKGKIDGAKEKYNGSTASS